MIVDFKSYKLIQVVKALQSAIVVDKFRSILCVAFVFYEFSHIDNFRNF